MAQPASPLPAMQQPERHTVSAQNADTSEVRWTPGVSQSKLAAALRPFGWTCTDEFWRRYYSDPWVFSLANAVERLTDEVSATLDTRRSPMVKMLSPEEVAELLSVDVRTLYAWRQAGTGPPATRLGKYLRYSADGLRAWVETHGD